MFNDIPKMIILYKLILYKKSYSSLYSIIKQKLNPLSFVINIWKNIRYFH